MTEEDRIAYEAWGCLQGFSRNPVCPEYIRDMVAEYEKRRAEARARQALPPPPAADK